MSQIAVNNYLVPAVGTPSADVRSFTLDGITPLVIEFRAEKIDGANFIPSGVYLSSDLTNTNTDLTISIKELDDFTFIVGNGNHTNYPAPPDQTLTLTGTGDYILVFVNYPII